MISTTWPRRRSRRWPTAGLTRSWPSGSSRRRRAWGWARAAPPPGWTTPPWPPSLSLAWAPAPPLRRSKLPVPPPLQVSHALMLQATAHTQHFYVPKKTYLMCPGNYRSLPVFQLLELVLNEDVNILDFSKNRDWIESEEMNEFSRILWKIVGERCNRLEKFIIPKELTYSSTLNSVIGELY